MNRRDLAEILELTDIHPSSYSVGPPGIEHAEPLCIIHEFATWTVFITERGSRFGEKTFDDEDEACVYFLKRLLGETALYRRRRDGHLGDC